LISSRLIFFRLLALSAIASRAAADDVRSLPEVEVSASRYSLIGVADSASEGVVGQRQLQSRVMVRTGELLEVVPGLIVSQHSGDGKANQYFLRGFNLDHGLDFKITLDGMPINQRSHAHGQGWADMNPLIPELISSVHYRKGPYYVADGDFANAGSAAIYTTDKLDAGIASVGFGQYGQRRALLANSPTLGDGKLLYALELSNYDGPWEKPDNYKKMNGVLRYSEGTTANGLSLTAMAYTGKWNATDQIPMNEYRRGLISRWGSMDTSSGANASRYSLSGEWRRSDDSGSWLAQAYVIQNYLDLYSNFEYSPDSQFNQRDSRITSGLNVARTWELIGMGQMASNTLGLQLQNDNISNSLGSTTARVANATCRLPGSVEREGAGIGDPQIQCRRDRVAQSSLGLYGENHVHWTDWFRTVAGLRGDFFRFNNTGLSNSANTDTVTQLMASPKLNVVFGPWSKTEYYYSIGNGFHSNDARGVTIGTGRRANGLARTFGQEVGLRTEVIDGLQSTLALFQLDSASEIVYVGDEGRTEDSGRRSRRVGVEFNNYWKANRWLTVDADFAYARGRFRDPGGDGLYIEGAVEGVASVAAIIEPGGPFAGALQLRHFGPRPLTQDNSQRSNGTTTLNGRMAYRIDSKTSIELMGINLLNSQHSAIDYYSDGYTYNRDGNNLGSGLAGRVFHPIEPRNFRIQFVARY
jgi:outer membrane receptor for Fe3+-dicitrate